MIRALVLTLAIVASLMISSPAAAKDTRTVIHVEVASNVSIEHYQIDPAIKFLNKYTGKTRMVRGKCVWISRCIRILTYTKMPPNWFAAGAPPVYPRVGFVRLTPKVAALRDKRARLRIMAHELGHARNLAHSSSCDSVMNSWIYCSTGLVPLRFTKSEKKFLRSI